MCTRLHVPRASTANDEMKYLLTKGYFPKKGTGAESALDACAGFAASLHAIPAES